MPQATWSGSGTLTGDVIPTFGFAADVPGGLGNDLIQRPLGVGPTANLRISLFIDGNTFVATTTTFEVYRDGIATGLTILVAAGVFGPPTLVGNFVIAFGSTERFDLRVSNPGGLAEAFKEISFGWSAVFF